MTGPGRVRRVATLTAVVCLLAAACGDDGVLGSAGQTPSSAVAASPTPSPDSSGASVTTVAESSTSMPATTSSTATTSTTTTTAPLQDVTIDPSLPGEVQGRDKIPWSEVDGDWVLALYSGDQVNGGFADGPTVLYLVSPAADVYEITAWPAGGREPWAILDWSPDGARALVRVGPMPPPDNDHQLILVDLATGDTTTALAVPETTWEIDASFTMPTGRNIVVGFDDGNAERVTVRRSGGSDAVLVDRPSVPQAIEWLYGQAGTSVVISDIDGIRLLDNQGVLLADLDTPGFECRVTRWWSAHSVLAACIPPSVHAAGKWYHQLWTIPDDGSAATPLTVVPGGIVEVDFGYVDARQVGGVTVMQWSGDCGASSMSILQPDGSGSTIPASLPVSAGGIELVTPQGPRLAVRYWDDCGQSQSWLGQIELDGTFRGELIPKVADRAGIVSAMGLP